MAWGIEKADEGDEDLGTLLVTEGGRGHQGDVKP